MPVVFTFNRTPAYLCSLALAVLHFSGAVQAADNPDCICEPFHFANNFSSAKHIFEGQIITAEVDDDRSLVNFTVDVDNVFRGAVETRMHLSTSLEDECRIRVYVGARTIFLTGKENKLVSSCDGPFESPSSVAPLFSTAVDLVENYNVLRRNTGGDLYQKLKTGASAPVVRHILTTAHKLDPKSPATDGAEKLSYRGLEVRVNGDRVVSYVWR